jgi:lactate dehydrogenase-like 2-hydroxyacid dehydrogenase
VVANQEKLINYEKNISYKKFIRKMRKRILKLFDAKLNKEDKFYSPEEVIELYPKDCDGIYLCHNKFDKEIINKLSDSVKIIANYAVGFKM